MSNLVSGRPDATEYASHYGTYISLVPEEDILDSLERQLEATLTLLRGVSEEEGAKRHAPYTWSVKEVVGHIIDAERIFAYRALRFARNDPAELPGFEENDYVREARFDRRSLADLVDELALVRRGNLLLFRNLDKDAWLRTGIASNARISVRALAYAVVGHERHHVNILRKRLAGA
jgi:hypothetical protein